MIATRVYTAAEVQDLLDDERSRTFLVCVLALIFGGIMGFGMGVWFVNNLWR